MSWSVIACVVSTVAMGAFCGVLASTDGKTSGIGVLAMAGAGTVLLAVQIAVALKERVR